MTLQQYMSKTKGDAKEKEWGSLRDVFLGIYLDAGCGLITTVCMPATDLIKTCQVLGPEETGKNKRFLNTQMLREGANCDRICLPQVSATGFSRYSLTGLMRRARGYGQTRFVVLPSI